MHVAGDQSEVCSHGTPAQPIQLKRPKASPTVSYPSISKPDEGDISWRGAPAGTKHASSLLNRLVWDSPEPPGTCATSVRCAGVVRWMQGGGGTPQQTVFLCLSSKTHFSCLLTAPVG